MVVWHITKVFLVFAKQLGALFGVVGVVAAFIGCSGLLVHCYMAARQLLGVSRWLLSIC